MENINTLMSSIDKTLTSKPEIVNGLTISKDRARLMFGLAGYTDKFHDLSRTAEDKQKSEKTSLDLDFARARLEGVNLENAKTKAGDSTSTSSSKLKSETADNMKTIAEMYMEADKNAMGYEHIKKLETQWRSIGRYPPEQTPQ
jgi:hypothetical protein